MNTAITQLNALAQDTRLSIFRLLMSSPPGGLSVGEIGERLAVAPATLSFHLKELSRAGLIDGRQDGRFIFYSSNYPAMRGLLDYLSEDCCAGAPCAVTMPESPDGAGQAAACCADK